MTFKSSLDISICCPQFEFNPNSFYDFLSCAIILLHYTWVDCHVLHKYALPWWHSSDKKKFKDMWRRKGRRKFPQNIKVSMKNLKAATVDFRLSHFHYQGNFSSCFSFGCAPTYPTYPLKVDEKVMNPSTFIMWGSCWFLVLVPNKFC